MYLLGGVGGYLCMAIPPGGRGVDTVDSPEAIINWLAVALAPRGRCCLHEGHPSGVLGACTGP
jgi:hypothetical protein